MTMFFRPDTVLRATYGGDTIVLDGSSQQTTPADMTIRHVGKLLGIAQKGVEYSLRVGTATIPSAGTVWLYLEDSDYALISGFLSAAELATATTTAPTGFAANNTRSTFSCSSIKPNVLFVGDSITAGTGYGAANDSQTLPWQVLLRLTGYISGSAFTPSGRVHESGQHRVFNNGIGSSSFDNAIAPNNDFLRRWTLRQNQQFRTLVLPSAVKNIMVVWLGTNDIAYDAALTGAACWARSVAFLNAMRAIHGSSLKMVVTTALRRADTANPNAALNAYNDLIRANWASAGYDAIADVERLTVDNSGTFVPAPYYPHKIISDGFGAAGTASNLNYYIDGTHPSAYAYTLMAPVFANAINGLL